jgi:hypothetical protein
MYPAKDSPFSPSNDTPDSQTPIHATQDINFAAAACALDLLSYAGTKLSDGGRYALLLLEDDANRGEELHRQFRAGLLPRLNIKLFLEARSFFQMEIARAFKSAGGRNAKG